jgi:hypothetical protein
MSYHARLSLDLDRQYGLQGNPSRSELDLWAHANAVALDFSRPANPTDNVYAHSFNATVGLEYLG